MTHKLIYAGLTLAASVLAADTMHAFDIAPAGNRVRTENMPRQERKSGVAAPDAMGAAKAPAKASSSAPVIYGMMIYSDTWYNLPDGASFPYGCYAMSKQSPTPSEMYAHPNLNAKGGGCYTDRQVHYRLYELLEESPFINNYYMVVNTDNWSYAQNPSLSHEDNSVANDMTYDPISKQIYAAVWGNFDGGATRLAIVDKVTGACEEIATLPDLACLAANNFGELYGVECLTGTLYKINKTTGEYVKVGETGLSPKYAQSATVDPQTNTIYWAATQTDNSAGVYTINTSTGKADLYFNLAGNEEFTCLFIEAPTRGLDAPAAISNLTMSSAEGRLNLAFKAPAKAFNGSSLSGALTARVYVDGKEAYSAATTPGAEVKCSLETADGPHIITAYVENSVGEGPKETREFFMGADLPSAPTAINLTVTGGVAALTWTAPTTGIRGGTIDPSKISYRVVRYPDGEVAAENQKETSLTQTLPSGMANWYYTVTSCSDGNAGGTGTSNSVFTGDSFTIPYSETFDTADSMQGFTTIDGDGDGNTWTYTDFNKAVWSRYNKYEQQNDWLITPPIRLEEGKEYTLTLKAKVLDSDSPERFEVKMGKAATQEGMTATVMPAVITKSEKYEEYKASFKAQAGGEAYFGFHAMSPANSYRLFIDDIAITEKVDEPEQPESTLPVGNAALTMDESGKLILTWTAPSATVSGKPVDKSKLSYTVLRSDGVQVVDKTSQTTFTDPTYVSVEEQKMVYYQVHTIYDGLTSAPTMSNFVVVGTPLDLPFAESFANQQLTVSPWTLSRLSGQQESLWTLNRLASNPDATAQDGDSGFATFVAFDKAAGISERMASPKIDLFSASHPVLKFYVYETTAQAKETLSVQISNNDNVFHTLADIPIHADKSGWKLYEIEIPRIYCKPSAMIAFVGTTARGYNIHLDNITIENGQATVGYDLQAVSLDVPDLMPDQEAELVLQVYNNGSNEVAQYSVTLLVNDAEAITSNSTEPIKPGETMEFKFKIEPEAADLNQTFRFRGRVKAAVDTNPANDETEEVVKVVGVTGITDAAVDNGETFNVYTPTGLLILTGAGSEEINALPAGLYILRSDRRAIKIAK